MLWRFLRRAWSGAEPAAIRRPAATASRPRIVRLEKLENRSLLAALPFGAMPDDTGEIMLGDVAVTVVLMESDPTLAPHDNTLGGRNSPVEDWTASAKDAVKSKIETGLQWWRDTLVNEFSNAPANLLNFNIDWTYLNSPVRTGYEPIDRLSNDFEFWIRDFFEVVGFDQSLDFSSNIRAYNNFKRQQGAGADWAFTIFVVNNAADQDLFFDLNGSFRQAFSYPGGQFMVVPASRPASTFAHEAGHQFWGLDEYAGSSTYLRKRGYYDTQNLNASDNPAFAPGAPGGQAQANSIMANDTPTPKLTPAFNDHTSSMTSLEMIGWKDSDGDGIFDVLDVPFTLAGSGHYETTTGLYVFTGTTGVDTLPNKNSSGLQNDVTINQIRAIQTSIDNGPWTAVNGLNIQPRTYQKTFDDANPLTFFVPPGEHSVRIRSIDTRTGVTSAIFVGSTTAPSSTATAGVSGYVFRDANNNGVWDTTESPLENFKLDLLDQNNAPVNLQRHVEPNEATQEGAVLNDIVPGAALSAIGVDTTNNLVTARTSTVAPAAGKVFWNNSLITGNAAQTWTGSGRQLRVDFEAGVGSVSIKTYSGAAGATAFARMEAYNAAGELVDRATTAALTGSTATVLTVGSAASDIRWVIVGGHAGTEVLLDSLDWGPSSSVKSNIHGLFSFPNLPPGTYHVKASPTTGQTVTIPVSSSVQATVTTAQSVNVGKFGVHVAGFLFHNAAKPLNVNNDEFGRITTIDALKVINWLNSHPNQMMLPDDGNPALIGYIDVTGDGKCSTLDALRVINYLNSPNEGEGEELSSLGTSASTSVGVSVESGEYLTAEGEAVAAPTNAEEYFAQNPFHVPAVPGATEPCHCGDCLDTHDAAIVQLSAGTRAKPNLSLDEYLSLLASETAAATDESDDHDHLLPS